MTPRRSIPARCAGGDGHRDGLPRRRSGYRINFATADWPEIVDRRVGRDLTSEESKALADEVNETLKCLAPRSTCRRRSSTAARW
jgi:2,3-bisphosphoglycerate-independent phosphoglycerate mutase